MWISEYADKKTPNNEGRLQRQWPQLDENLRVVGRMKPIKGSKAAIFVHIKEIARHPLGKSARGRTTHDGVPYVWPAKYLFETPDLW